MTLDELYNHYGTWADMNRDLNLGNSTYLKWRKKGYIPYDTQCRIEKDTKKRFKASRAHGEPSNKK